jgi:hypothetical protein
MGDMDVSAASHGLRCAAAAALAALGGMGTGACSSNSTAQATGEHVDEAGAAGSGSAGSSGFATDAHSAGASSGASSGAGSSGAGTSGASSSGAQSEGGAPVACTANCTGKTCGTDGCSGTCGGCPPSQLCGPAQTCVTPADTMAVVVDANSQTTPISSAIYGVAFNSDDSMRVAGLNRWGGDATSSYNWKIDVSNAGADWNCANYAGRFTSPAPDPSLHTNSDQFVHYNISEQADTLMTIPITGWVASMATPNPGSPDCAGGTAISSCCTTLGTSEEELVDKGSSVLDTSFMGDWVTHLVQTFGPGSGGGVRYYQLDNEPDNWQALRKDIYPALYPPGTWCEPFYSTNTSIGTSLNQDFINRTMAYSKAIKAADPTAAVLFMSTENAQDLVALPNVECGNPAGPYTVDGSLTKAILQLAAADEASSNMRLLDCVDMHYPFPGMGLGDTNALWDSTSSSVVPHVQGWINATYPGTGICVSEYNVPNDGGNGQTPDASTGAEEADILGMFGRLGYRVAAYWTTLVSGSTHLPVYNAMAMYRDYDGNGGRFGAVSIGAASPYAGVNVYAASDSPTSPTKVWVMLVNISGANQLGISVALQNFTAVGSAEVYRMTSGAAPAPDTALAIAGGRITGLSLPSNSAALVVLSN